MQVSVSSIIFTISILTFIGLIMVTAVLAFVAVYNRKKRRHFIEKTNLQRQFNEQMLQSQLEIQEITFRNLSSEIHDNVGQILSLSTVQLNLLEKDPQKVKISDIKENVMLALDELRYLAHNINGDHLMEMSLNTFLEKQSEKVNKSGMLQCVFINHADDPYLSTDHKVILFRIVQECIQNSLKHAFASEIIITTKKFNAKELSIAISDNGRGFHTSIENIKKQHGLGLKTMEKRMGLLKGFFDLHSQSDVGTTITLTIPYEERAFVLA